MILKTTYDIETRQPVYAICDSKTERCGILTTDLMKALRFAQLESFDQANLK